MSATFAAMDGDAERAREALATLAAVRGEYDEDELRQVLEVGLAHARGELARAFSDALQR